MSEVDLESEQYERHREAGEILSTVRSETIERVEIGASHLEIAEFAEDRIRELGGAPGFPVNISIDEEAAHGTPAPDDTETFGEAVVNLDFGVHVDGWLADSAITVDLTGDHADLVAASRDGLEAAIDRAGPGVQTGELGAAIQDAIEGHGYNPVVNLSGHGLGHWTQHTTPSIPNRAIDDTPTLEVGDVVAIEPFATDGSGKVSEGGKQQIYSLEDPQTVRNRSARQVLEEIEERFRTLPFAVRWIEQPRAEMALRRLEMQDVVHGYPVLSEREGCLVSQAEHTIIVTPDGCEVTTR